MAIAIGVVLIVAGWATAVGREIRHNWRGSLHHSRRCGVEALAG